MNDLPVYYLRDLAALPPASLWTIPRAKIVLRCDDGDFITTTRRAIWSVLVIRDFYLQYPDTATRTRHLLPNDKLPGKMTHGQVLDAVLWDTYDTYVQKGEAVNVEHLGLLAYQATNRLYNELLMNTAAHVQSMSILDFIDVIHHPKIREAQSNVRATPSSIERVYNTIGKVLKDPNELKGNRLANIVKTGLVDQNQVVQCVGPRGFTTDIDSTIFREPILTGFTHGFHRFYDSLVDSRLAAKAQSFTGPPLQATEYFNRQLQLLAHTFIGIVPGDCGSKRVVEWRVRARDLACLDGMYYESDMGLLRVRKNDDSLVDQLIRLRTPATCDYEDSQRCCQACYGELALAFPASTNVGHVAATNLGEKISQKVLSIKHVESSSSVDDAAISSYALKYIQPSLTDVNMILGTERMTRMADLKIVFQAHEAKHINDIRQAEDLSKVALSFISELTEIQLTHRVKTGIDTVTFSTIINNSPASLSFPMLEHIRKVGLVQSDDARTYVVSMEGFNFEEPIFEMPRRHVNMLDYAESVKEFLCSATRKGGNKTLRDHTTVDAALKSLYNLVSRQMQVNVVHLAALIKVSMIRSRSNRDYQLPNSGNAVEFGEFTTTMYLRSMSAAMAYQGQRQALERPMLYLIRNRPSHTLDWMLVPNVNKLRNAA